MPIRFLFLLFLLSLPLSARAKGENPRVSTLLATLDSIVEHKADCHAERNRQAARLKEQAGRATGHNRILICKELFDLYSHYQTDSAQAVLDRIIRLPEYATDEELQAYHHIAQAELLSVVTLYGEAASQLQQVPPRMVSADHSELRLYYLRTLRTLYGWMADYTKIPSQHVQWMAKTDSYRDSLLAIGAPGKDHDIVRADKAVAHGRPREALRLLLPYAGRMDELRPDPYVCFILSSAYTSLGLHDEALYYLVLTAIADLRSAKTEYQALPILAQALFEKGDIERAYRYLLCSMEDASFCKAGLRTLEVTHVFPIIDKRYKEYEAGRRSRDRTLLYCFIGMTALLVASLLYTRKQMRRLRTLRRVQTETNRQLSAANEKMSRAMKSLQSTNDELQQAYAELRLSDKMKEEYIARYLDRCRGYIDTLDEYRRTSLRLIKDHRTDELSKILKSESLIKGEQEKFFADFDAAFLTLFPDFIERFNALLRPGEEIVPRHGGHLNTELRIFALIRLGVSDTQRIAHFLNFSLATVYNYRSKVRNKAKGSPSDLERMVGEIG